MMYIYIKVPVSFGAPLEFFVQLQKILFFQLLKTFLSISRTFCFINIQLTLPCGGSQLSHVSISSPVFVAFLLLTALQLSHQSENLVVLGFGPLMCETMWMWKLMYSNYFYQFSCHFPSNDFSGHWSDSWQLFFFFFLSIHIFVYISILKYIPRKL